jgi:hypothetical protein
MLQLPRDLWLSPIEMKELEPEPREVESMRQCLATCPGGLVMALALAALVPCPPSMENQAAVALVWGRMQLAMAARKCKLKIF